MLPELELSRPLSLDLSRLHGCKVWVWVWLEAFSFLRTTFKLDACNPEQMACLSQVGARFALGLARGFLCLLSLSLAWRPLSLEPGGEASSFLLGVEIGWQRGGPGGSLWGTHPKGDLTRYSPAACRAYRAAHSCLWDWELCRPSCLAYQLRRIRPAQRPRAHSV